MALTNLSSPDTHTPCFNPQTFCFSSTNTAQPNFTYHVILTIDGDTITRDVDAHPTDDKFYFDAQKNVESYCNNEIYDTILDFQYSLDGAIMKVEWSVQEKYGTTPSLQGAATTGTYYVWNASYKTLDFPSFSYATTGSTKDLSSLTDTIHFEQKWLFKYMHDGFSTTVIRYLYIDAYDSAGVNIQASILENQFYIGVIYQAKYWMINISPYGLNNFAGIITSKSVPLDDVIPANTSYYTMRFYNTTPVPCSSGYQVNISEFCSIGYDRYVLHYLNKLGGYDSFTFGKLNRRTFENKKSSYKKFPLRNLSNVYTYLTSDSDEVNYATTVKNKLILNSDFVTDAQMRQLTDLFNSPSVYLETPDDPNEVGDQRKLIAVKLTNNQFEEKQKVNDKIFNVTVEVEYLFEDSRQRG